MHIYRYERFDKPQSVLYDDLTIAKSIHSKFLKLQRHIRSLVRMAEEPNFQQSLMELDHALDNFVSDEVEPIISLLENAQADINTGPEK